MCRNGKASVCIPAYNEEFIIGRLLDYIVEQDRSLVGEILVCANGCTDNTEAVVENYSDPRIKLITLEKIGKPRVWNTILAYVQHDTVVFFDADVLPEKHCIEALVNILAAEDHLIAVGGTVISIVEATGIMKLVLKAINTPMAPYNIFPGSVYALKKNRLTALIKKMGYDEGMPLDLLTEEIWLQSFLTREDYKVTADARVYHDYGNLEDSLKRIARDRLVKDQLGELYPELYRSWKKEFMASGNIAMFFLECLNQKKGFNKKMKALFDYTIKLIVQLRYKGVLKDHCRKMREICSKDGGRVVMAGYARTRSAPGRS